MHQQPRIGVARPRGIPVVERGRLVVQPQEAVPGRDAAQRGGRVGRRRGGERLRRAGRRRAEVVVAARRRGQRGGPADALELGGGVTSLKHGS